MACFVAQKQQQTFVIHSGGGWNRTWWCHNNNNNNTILRNIIEFFSRHANKLHIGVAYAAHGCRFAAVFFRLLGVFVFGSVGFFFFVVVVFVFAGRCFARGATDAPAAPVTPEAAAITPS